MHKTLENTGEKKSDLQIVKVSWCFERYHWTVCNGDWQDRLIPKQVNTPHHLSCTRDCCTTEPSLYKHAWAESTHGKKVETQTPHLCGLWVPVHCGGLSQRTNWSPALGMAASELDKIPVTSCAQPASPSPVTQQMILASCGQSGQYEAGQLWFVCPAPLSYWTIGQ